MHLPKPGDLFQEKYLLRAELGRGGFATVFLAVDERALRNVAIKVLDPGDYGYSSGMEDRFLREVRVLASLRDPHTITMFDYGQTDDGLLFMVFEYIEGRDLEEVIEQAGALHERDAFHVMQQVLQSLREAHGHGLLHRDIKPANIRIFEYMGDRYRAKLLDFGIARAAAPGDAKITRDGAMVGTPRYMAPEQVFGDDPSPASDIYSLGLVAFEMLVGTDAVKGESTADILRRQASLAPIVVPPDVAVSPGVRAVVEKMLVKHPGGRYQSADAVISALEAVHHSLKVPGAGGFATPVPPSAFHTPAPQQAVHTPPFGSELAAVVRVSSQNGRPPGPVQSAAPQTGEESTGRTSTGTAHRTLQEEAARRDTRVLLSGGVVLVVALVLAAAAAFVLSPAAEEEPESSPPVERVVMQVSSEVERVVEVASLEVGLALTLASRAKQERSVELQDGCATNRQGGESVTTFEFEGRIRQVALYAPRGYTSERQHPVVLLYHDNREQRVGQFLRATRFGELAEREPMIVVSPQATESNPKMADPPVPWRDPEHEIRFADALIDHVAQLYCIDDSRVFAVGHGTGGEMVEKLRCGFPLSAVAITSEHLIKGARLCEPTAAVPVIEFWGRADRYNPSRGGKPAGCPARAERLSTRQHQEVWRKANGCGPARSVDTKRKDYSCETWSSCEVPFVSCTHSYGSGWSGTTYTGLETFVSDCFGPSARFDIAGAIWEFFEAEGRRIESGGARE